MPVLNKTAKSVIEERMRSSADGRTVVDVKKVFFQVAHQIISQVYMQIHSVCMKWSFKMAMLYCRLDLAWIFAKTHLHKRLQEVEGFSRCLTMHLLVFWSYLPIPTPRLAPYKLGVMKDINKFVYKLAVFPRIGISFK